MCCRCLCFTVVVLGIIEIVQHVPHGTLDLWCRNGEGIVRPQCDRLAVGAQGIPEFGGSGIAIWAHCLLLHDLKITPATIIPRGCFGCTRKDSNDDTIIPAILVLVTITLCEFP